MKNFISGVLVSALVVASGIAQTVILNPNLTVNSTIQIGGANASFGDVVSQGSIKGSSLDATCAMRVRQTPQYIAPDGVNDTLVVAPYAGPDVNTTINFQKVGIPDGSLVDLILEVFDGPDLDLDLWFTVNYSSPCVATYSCTGTIFKYSYSFLGLNCTATVPKFGQCGGQGYTGPTICDSDSTCAFLSDFFSQCL